MRKQIDLNSDYVPKDAMEFEKQIMPATDKNLNNTQTINNQNEETILNTLEDKLASALSANNKDNKSRKYSKYSTYNEDDKDQRGEDLVNDYD